MKKLNNYILIVVVISMVFGCKKVEHAGIATSKKSQMNGQIYQEEIVEYYRDIANFWEAFMTEGVSSEQVINVMNQHDSLFNVFDAMKNSGYYQSYFQEGIVDIINFDFPFYEYHIMKKEGTPLMKEILASSLSETSSSSALDSIICTGYLLPERYNFDSLMMNEVLLPNEKMFIAKIFHMQKILKYYDVDGYEDIIDERCLKNIECGLIYVSRLIGCTVIKYDNNASCADMTDDNETLRRCEQENEEAARQCKEAARQEYENCLNS